MHHTRPLAQDYTVVAAVPEDGDEFYTYFLSDAFVRLPSGTLVAAGPMVKGGGKSKSERPTDATVRVARSTDSGVSWTVCADMVFPVRVEVALFAQGETLAMIIGRKSEGGPILVSTSDDEGTTWSAPIEVARNPGVTGDTFYCLHQTATVVKDDRLYLAVSEECQRLAMLVCDLSKGVCTPDAWSLGPAVDMPIPEELNPGLFPGPSMRCLEGNTLDVNGRLRVLARAVIDRYATANLAALYDVNDEGDEAKLEFVQFYPCPGGNGKFFIVYDEPSRLYWMASNPPANSQGVLESPLRGIYGNDRRFLMLWYAVDALNWFPAGCIAYAEKMNEAFMYPSVIVEGDDLLVLSRTAHRYSGRRADDRAKSGFHDANMLTLHRVRDFRSLAMPIHPRA